LWSNWDEEGFTNCFLPADTYTDIDITYTVITIIPYLSREGIGNGTGCFGQWRYDIIRQTSSLLERNITDFQRWKQIGIWGEELKYVEMIDRIGGSLLGLAGFERIMQTNTSDSGDVLHGKATMNERCTWEAIESGRGVKQYISVYSIDQICADDEVFENDEVFVNIGAPGQP
jgi:hypothetical protein